MSGSTVSGKTVNSIASQRLRDVADYPGPARDAIVRAACALLTPEQMAEVAANRICIEQTKGMLMVLFDVDADQAFEFLVWRSQATNVKLRIVARELAAELLALRDGPPAPTRGG